jgi:hypothetical protein
MSTSSEYASIPEAGTLTFLGIANSKALSAPRPTRHNI